MRRGFLYAKLFGLRDASALIRIDYAKKVLN